jgi:RecB family exonuclease
VQNELILFEETWARDQFLTFYPELDAALCQTWEEFLEAAGEPATDLFAQARAQFVQALKDTPSEKGDWLATVEQLRQAPLRTTEDVEFCFSFLPSTAKNAFLKQLLELYLGSPLAEHDLVSRNERVIAQLDQGDPSVYPPLVVFLRARTPTSGFEELFTALAGWLGADRCRYLETWQWQPAAHSQHSPTSFARVHVSTEHLPTALDRFAQKVAQMKQRLPAAQLRVFFEGTPASRAYLGSRLAHEGVEVAPQASTTPPDFHSRFFQALRTSALSLTDRLRLSAAWLRAPQKIALEQLDAWMQAQKLAPDHQSLLRDLANRSARVSPTKFALLPFHPLPLSAGSVSLFFLEPIPEPSGVLALDADERFRLRVAGFAVPEAEPHRERNSQRLQALLASGPGHAVVFYAGVPPLAIERTIHLPTDSQPPVLRISDSQTPTLPPGPYSATALEMYAQCPAQYFYSYGARLRATQDPKRSFSLWFGKTVHRTLERAFKQTPWQQVNSSALKTLFDESVSEMLPADLPAWMKISLRRRFVSVADQVPKMEQTLREAFGPLTPVRFEEDFQVALGQAIFRGRIDRLDETPDGSALIIDYKTGAVDFSPEQIKKGNHFQALIYALAGRKRSEKAAGVLFYDLKQGEVKRGLVRETQVSPTAKKAMTRGHALDDEKWEQVVEQGYEHAHALITAIESGDFAPTPSAAACDFCDFGTHCRNRLGWTGGTL